MRINLVAFVAAAIALPTALQAAEPCGPLINAYGPYDYRKDKDKLTVVENFHFNSRVEQLVSGMSGSLGGDIDYTLRAFPNHHRALMSVARLGEKLKTDKPPGAGYTVSCYFERAIRFQPDDGMARVIFATYLAKTGKNSEAIEQMQAAEQSLGDNANLHYNLGLAYLSVKNYDKALEHAHIAYRLGFPLPGLRNLLTRQGKWRESPAVASSEVTVPSASELEPSRPTSEEPAQQNK
jgi:tetratricopeptide (TPR) repeat protein